MIYVCGIILIGAFITSIFVIAAKEFEKHSTWEKQYGRQETKAEKLQKRAKFWDDMRVLWYLPDAPPAKRECCKLCGKQI